jgi:hypothetical protein
MDLDFSKCETPEDIEEVFKKANAKVKLKVLKDGAELLNIDTRNHR